MSSHLYVIDKNIAQKNAISFDVVIVAVAVTSTSGNAYSMGRGVASISVQTWSRPIPSPSLPSFSFPALPSFLLFPSHHPPLPKNAAAGSWECCKLPSVVCGGVPAANAFLCILSSEIAAGDDFTPSRSNTRQPCCRKETTQCRSCPFRFKVRRQHSLQV